MVFKKSFTLLVATGTTSFFVVVPIIFEIHCREFATNARRRDRECTSLSEQFGHTGYSAMPL